MKIQTLVIMFSLFASAHQAQAYANFFCSCLANGPGYEQGASAEKICSYNCSCSGIKADNTLVQNISIPVNSVRTTAYSYEAWDAGSHICHGQYSWRPRLDSPNWDIQVKFLNFTITADGLLGFPEMVETSTSFREALQHSSEAPEILQVLRSQLLRP